jgi:hypothetical protein
MKSCECHINNIPIELFWNDIIPRLDHKSMRNLHLTNKYFSNIIHEYFDYLKRVYDTSIKRYFYVNAYNRKLTLSSNFLPFFIEATISYGEYRVYSRNNLLKKSMRFYYYLLDQLNEIAKDNNKVIFRIITKRRSIFTKTYLTMIPVNK